LLAPRYRVRGVTELSLERLRHWQIVALMLDLDNTLVPWGRATPSAAVQDWMAGLLGGGVTACLVSNSLSDRALRVAAVLGVPHARGGFKPGVAKLRRALAIMGTPSARTAMVGDQLFTDILAGNRLGVPTVLTQPLDTREPVRMIPTRGLERRVLAMLARRGLAPPVPEV
jgi:hypothetical protein